MITVELEDNYCNITPLPNAVPGDYFYLYIGREGRNVDVAIKIEDTGIVIDVHDRNDPRNEAVASTWVDNNDLLPMYWCEEEDPS